MAAAADVVAWLPAAASYAHYVIVIVLSLSIIVRRRGKDGRAQTSGGGGGRYAFAAALSAGTLAFALAAVRLALCGWTRYWRLSSGEFSAAAAWFAVAAHLQSLSRHYSGERFPAEARAAGALILLTSLASLAADIAVAAYLHGPAVSPFSWVLHGTSLAAAVAVGFAVFCGRRERRAGDACEPLIANPAGERNNASLFANAGFLSILTFSWMGPLFAVGHKKTLDLADVPLVVDDDSVRCILPVFETKLEQINSKSTDAGAAKFTALKLAKALFLLTWKQVLLTAAFALIYNLATYVGPYLINDFVQFLNGTHRSAGHGYALVIVFVVSKLAEGLSQRHWFFQVQQAGLRARSALMPSIYKKGLRLSNRARQSRTTGEMINILSVDAEKIALFSWYMHDLWLVPVQVGLALLILYMNLGMAALAALAATVVLMLLNVPLGKLQEKYEEKLMEAKDVRMKAMTETLRNMRILKLQGWEMKFLSKIIDLRKTEASWLMKYVYSTNMVSFIFMCTTTFVAAVTFSACIFLRVPLESGKVLSALATFGALQEPIYTLPDVIAMIIQTKVSLDRIASFLCSEDLPTDTVQELPVGTSDAAVEVINGCFSWNGPSEAPTLKELNFKVLRGMRVAVCGTVGSGKSSLLSCILGEVPKISGEVKICGSTAYVSQTPWIQSGKIQDNILFGEAMDEAKYDRVLEACSLKKDLEILPLGDRTVIGERGINLSGGQKQRVQIARALYQDADIYMFDDPFSALDAHTGSHLFKECLLGLLASKTVLYVTHQVEFLPSADLILVMKDGKIVQAGQYSEILDSGGEFMELVGAHKEALSAVESMALSKDAGAAAGSSNVEGGEVSKAEKEEASKGQLVQEEEREKGKVGFWVYWRYITTAYGGALVPVILLAQILFQVLQIGSSYWMASATPVSKDDAPPVGLAKLLYVYTGLALGSTICVLIRSVLLATAGYKTATLLFNKMHECLFRAPMSFFDSTPSGRILNRASTDQSEVDTTIPSQIGQFGFAVLQLLAIIFIMAQVAWQVFIVFIPVIAASIWYQQYYIATARELSRLVGTCKAPIIQQFSESLAGSTTIRSFGKEDQFLETNGRLMDDFSRPKFYTSAAREWLCFRLDMLSAITFSFSLVFLVMVPRGVINPAIAGLVVTYGLNLNAMQSWVIWILCNLENKIISVERIFQYSAIPSEPPLNSNANALDSRWPSDGEIKIQELQVRYAPQLPFVLKGISCTFQGGSKTGIVGRTGSGKSTLIQVLFRLMDPTMGRILVDGIDICSVGLHDLRSRLSIIPQDPTMFEGTIRTNLDPLEEYTDDQIWQALDCCQLGDEVRKKELKLDSPVTENGENWSVGQRQLVCLGRVVLKKSKILVLDEATASVDTATDNLIQKTLRQEFSVSTVITVAHRITSILDSDMVLLLNNGVVVEHDNPAKLLEDKSSLFSKLVMEYTMRSNYS